MSAVDTMKKSHKEYMAAVVEVARATRDGNSNPSPVSGIASVSPLVRLPYWHHKAMVAMGICHLLFHNTVKKFLKMVRLFSPPAYTCFDM